MKKHIEGTHLKCSICKIHFDEISEWKVHIVSNEHMENEAAHKEKQPHKCSLCEKSFATGDALI